MKKSTKIILSCLVGIVLLAIAGAGALYYYFLSPQFFPREQAYIYIDRDDTIDSIYYKVEAAGNPKQMTAFKIIATHKKLNQNLRTGKYHIAQGDSPNKLASRLTGGIQTPVKLTIGSVRTLDRIARQVGNQLMIDSAEVAYKLNDPIFIGSLGYTEESIYNLFIPDTYEVYWNMSVDDFFKRMQKEHDRFWNDTRKQKAEEIGLTPEQVYILASIVDEETNSTAEKPIVAGLYLNRLRKGMLLQADPTVKFAWQDFELRRVTNAHLEIDSPYNTYKYSGLPPGPIRVPSKKGIDSVLNYTKHNYIYMCAKEDFSGTHNFASTLAEHTNNARKYWKALNDRKIYR